MAAKVRALQEWCRQQCDGYRNVAITNMTSSWKSGLAFCAIIHRYRPDLIDYDSLSKEDVFRNNKLAFDVAHDKLGIPALLDPEDMVMMAVPDKLCIVTYVAQYYNYFHNKPRAARPALNSAAKRPALEDVATAVNPTSPSLEPSVKKSAPSDITEHRDKHAETSVISHRGGTLDDRCHMCRGRVYLLERHYTAAGHLYHRHCYRAYQRTAPLHKSKQHSDKEHDDKQSSGGAMLSSGKIGVQSSSKDVNHIHGSGSSIIQDSRFTSSDIVSSAQCTRGSTVISSHDKTASNMFSGLMKALYTTPSYKQSVTNSESVAPTVSHIATTVSRLTTTSTPAAVSDKLTVTPVRGVTTTDRLIVTPVTTVRGVTTTGKLTVTPATTLRGVTTSDKLTVTPATTIRGVTTTDKLTVTPVKGVTTTDRLTVTPATTTRGVTTSKTGSSQSVFANARAQYLQRVGGLTEPAVVTSTATISMPNYSAAGKFGRNITSNYGALLTLSTSAGPSRTIDGLKTATSDNRTSHRMSTSPIVDTNTGVTTAFSWSSSSSTHQSVQQPTYSVVSTCSSDASRFLNDRLLSVTSSSCVTSVPYTAVIKSTTVACQRPLITVASQPLTTLHTSTQQQSSAKNSVSNPDSDGRMVKSLLQSFAEARERKQQSVVVSTSSVQSVVSVTSPMMRNRQTEMTNKTEWQLEVERRQVARNGVYVDPERYLKSCTGQQLPYSHVNSNLSAMSKLAPNMLDIERKTRLSSSIADATAADRMYKSQPSLVGDVVDVPVTHHQVDRRRRQQPMYSHSEMNPQHHRLRSKKWASVADICESPVDITRRLEELDAALRVVESEGRDLEERIRKDSDDAMDDDKDSRMVRWFVLVKKRNELIREESDLIYRRRQEELEELHEELLYQLRPLLDKSDEQKTSKEKYDEDRLLSELLEVVSLRNNIVDSIEVDRLRYIQEDKKIEDMIAESGLYKDKTKAGKKSSKKKARVLSRKESKLQKKEKSKRRLSLFTSRSSL